MLRSSWLWSDWRYRVVVGLIYDPGHLWPESTHDLIWGSSPVYAWPLTKRGPQHKLNSLLQRSAALASSVCFTCAVHMGSCSGETSRLISHALERPPWSYIYARFMESLWARVHVKRGDPSYSCLYVIFLPFLLYIRMKRCWLKHKNTLRFGNRFWINGEVGAKVESWL